MPGLLAATPAPRVKSIVRADKTSGRLVRTMAVISVEAPMATAEILTLIDTIAAQHGVEDALVHSLIRAESNYNPIAISPKGAIGMMQLIPATAKRFGVNNPFDVRENIEGGVKYLKFLLSYYQDDYTKTIAAYNAGENAVDRYHGIPPYTETQNYVSRVAGNLQAARGRKKTAPVLEAVNRIPAAETHQAIRASVGADGRVYYRTE
ncbi:MAG: murein transglycosylase [Bryobacterales bacterium]|nr:murein transglycosylase [Bryobacterales bacterium]